MCVCVCRYPYPNPPLIRSTNWYFIVINIIPISISYLHLLVQHAENIIYMYVCVYNINYNCCLFISNYKYYMLRRETIKLLRTAKEVPLQGNVGKEYI